MQTILGMCQLLTVLAWLSLPLIVLCVALWTSFFLQCFGDLGFDLVRSNSGFVIRPKVTLCGWWGVKIQLINYIYKLVLQIPQPAVPSAVLGAPDLRLPDPAAVRERLLEEADSHSLLLSPHLPALHLPPRRYGSRRLFLLARGHHQQWWGFLLSTVMRAYVHVTSDRGGQFSNRCDMVYKVAKVVHGNRSDNHCNWPNIWPFILLPELS